jgi:hypothetical protein
MTLPNKACGEYLYEGGFNLKKEFIATSIFIFHAVKIVV